MQQSSLELAGLDFVLLARELVDDCHTHMPAAKPLEPSYTREELLASDALTLASRHSVTAGESCDGSTVADVCDLAWL